MYNAYPLGYAPYTERLISYREKMCKPELFHEDFVYNYHFLESGVLPVKKPDWIDFPNDIRCFSQWRVNYNIIVNYFLPDIFEIQKCLSDTGIIKEKSEYDESMGEDLDNKLWILNSGTEILDGELQAFNHWYMR